MAAQSQRYSVTCYFLLVIFSLFPRYSYAADLPTLPDAANILYWFAADHGTLDFNGNPCVNNMDIFTWQDQSGRGGDIQSAHSGPARSATCISDGINGHPAIDFNNESGNADLLLSNDSYPHEGIAQTLFILFKPENPVVTGDPRQYLLDGWNPSAHESITIGEPHYTVSDAVTGVVSHNTGGEAVATGSGPGHLNGGQAYLLSVVYDSSSQVFKLYMDGIHVGNLNTANITDDTAWSINMLAIGASTTRTAGFEGMISEIIFYETSLNDTDRSAIEDYLMGKYLLPSAGQKFWFSADYGVWADAMGTVPVTDGTDVQLWQDRSGNGYDLIPSHPGPNRAATFSASGISGMPALQFNNEFDSSELAADKMQNTGLNGALTTLFYVFMPDAPIGNSSSSSDRQVLIAGGSEINTWNPYWAVGDAHMSVVSSNGSANRAWGYDPADDRDIPAYPTVLAVNWRAGDGQYDLRINGTPVGNLSTAGDDSNAFDLSGLYIGAHSSGAYGLQGQLAEVIGYDTALTEAEIDAVERYLRGKYNAPSTFHVDPVDGNDTNSGLSSTKAWKTLDRVNNSRLLPGDTVLISRGQEYRDRLRVPTSGAKGLPITFAAYGEGAKPLFHGGTTVSSDSWTGPDALGVYRISYSGSPYFVAEDDNLFPHASSPDCSDGNWHLDTTTSTLCYKPTSGVAADHQVDLILAYTAIDIVGKSYIEISHLATTLVEKGIYLRGGADDPVTHVTVKHCDLTKGGYGIHSVALNGNDHTDLALEDNTFSNMRLSIGLYALGNGPEAHRNSRVTGNILDKAGMTVGSEIWHDLGGGDWEGIGLQNLNDSDISHNVILNGSGLTSAIGVWVHETAVSRNNTFTYNYINNVYGSCLNPHGQRTGNGGSIVAYNIIINCGWGEVPYADGFGGLRLSTAASPPTKIYNNLLIGNDINIYLYAAPDNFDIKNNISINPVGYHVLRRDPGIAANVLDHNLYFPDSSAAFRLTGVDHNFAGWKQATNQENNSLNEDPLFQDAAGGNYRLTASSPAIDGGVSHSFTEDFESNAIDGLPDIGVYEYQDKDNDGVMYADDNCPSVSNASQDDLDNDGTGDACDDDIDGDGWDNSADNCPVVSNFDQADLDNDGQGDVCDTDKDGDGVLLPADCDDTDPSLYPGAPEIRHDSIDQDCNGYDLTIDITYIDYHNSTKLTVWATSSLSSAAALSLDGFGPMEWNPTAQQWEIATGRIEKPASVTVTGVEGSWTEAVQ